MIGRIVIGLLLACIGLAHGAEVGPRRALLGSGAPTWVFNPGGQRPAIDCYFTLGQCWIKGQGVVSATSQLTTTRASQETCTDASGNITYAANNAPCLTSAGLQVWEARTNQQTYSAVNTTGWSTNNATLNGASVSSPDGTVNAATITDNAVNGIHGVVELSQTVIGSQTQTSSIFLKQGTIRYAEWLCYDVSGNGVVIFADLQLGLLSGSGTIGAGATYVSSSITQYANGWWRVSLTGAMTSGTTLWQDLRMSPDGSSASYVGTGSTLFAWGAQLEQATFASPYIPTTSGTASRAADAIKLTTPPMFGAAYSLVAWGTPAAPAAYTFNQFVASISDGTTNNNLSLDRGSGSAPFVANINSGGVGTNQTGGTWNQSALGKVAESTNGTTQSAAYNATMMAGTTNANPIGANTIFIGANGGAVRQFDGTISRIAIWPTTALSAAALQQVTQ